MATASNIHLVDTLIGRPVLARMSANKIGQLFDLIVDAAKGELAGLVVRMPDESLRCVEHNHIHGFGPDAVVIESDESAIAAEDSPLKALPLAKHNLIGVNVLTEGGKLLGQIANVYIRLDEMSLLIYEVRSSILDKLLGHSLYFPATNSRAISGDFARLIVSEATAVGGDHSLDALVARLFGPPKKEEPVVVVRSRVY
jgi:uncharacterized protein YrrD